jgi:signal transduction histidine kinase
MEESERILNMLNTLMDISEAETGAMKLDVEAVNLSVILRNVADLYQYVAEEKGVRVEVTSPQDLPVQADSVRMRQVLGNLLDNAIKYTPTGGWVRLEAVKTDQGVEISVRDNGVGIPNEDLPRIWNRLYRGDRSRSEKGLGLGLSLVKAIVQAHKGRIDAQSEVNRGSTFQITLP